MVRCGVGQLDCQVRSAWLHAGGSVGLVGAWLVEREIRLDDEGSAVTQSEPLIAHWLLVDRVQNRAWVAVRDPAHMIVRRQQVEPTDAELAEIDEFVDDPTLSRFISNPATKYRAQHSAASVFECQHLVWARRGSGARHGLEG
jgi:hypothetical protein